MRLAQRLVAIGVAAGSMLMVVGCSDGIRQHIREKDFRSKNTVNPALAASPSPIANVADMPGWTTDIDGSNAFARENGLKTVVFVQQGESPASRAMKTALNADQIRSALEGVEKITFDAQSAPELAARYQVEAPAVVVLDGTGNAVGQQAGKLNRAALLAAVR